MAAKAFGSLQPNMSGSDVARQRKDKTNFQHMKQQATVHNEKNDYSGNVKFTSTQVTQTTSYETLFSLSKGKHECVPCTHSNSFHKKNSESQYTTLALNGQNLVVTREIAAPDIDNAIDGTANNTFIDPEGKLFNTVDDNNPYLKYVNVDAKDASDNLVKFDFPQAVKF